MGVFSKIKELKEKLKQRKKDDDFIVPVKKERLTLKERLNLARQDSENIDKVYASKKEYIDNTYEYVGHKVKGSVLGKTYRAGGLVKEAVKPVAQYVGKGIKKTAKATKSVKKELQDYRKTRTSGSIPMMGQPLPMFGRQQQEKTEKKKPTVIKIYNG